MRNSENEVDFDLESAPEPSWDAAWDDPMSKELEIALPRRQLQSSPPSRSRTAHLDGLRGVAALLVYLSHVTPWWYGIDSPLQHGFGYHNEYMLATFPFIRSIYTGGVAAVAIFFVMSGYVLSLSPVRLLDEGKIQDARNHLVVAAVKRPIRLFGPVVATSLIFLVWMHTPFAPQMEWPKAEENIGREIWKWMKEIARLVNIFAKHGPEEHWFPYNPPAWTMAAELAGSWTVYGLLWVTANLSEKSRYRCFATVGILAAVFYQWELACFMYGVLLTMDRKNDNSNWKISTALFILACWLLGQPAGKREPELSYATPGWYYLTTALTPPAYYEREFWRWWNGIGAIMLIDSINKLQWLKRQLTSSWCQYLGRVSFMLYLIHIPLLWTVDDKVARVLGVQRQAFTSVYDNRFQIPDLGPWGVSSGFLIWQAIVLPLNLWLAHQATKWIDAPSLRLGKWFVVKLGVAKPQM